mgnify:CR=1 FL=1
MSLTGQSFIGFSRGSGEETCGSAVNPSTGETLSPEMLCATDVEIEQALDLAAQARPVLKKKSGAEKATLLRAIASNIEAKLDELVERAPLETGLPEARIQGETGRTTGQLRSFAALIEKGEWLDARIEHAQPDRAPIPKPDLRSMLRPLGTVAVFAASNFPLAFSVAGGDTASALAAGCPVVVKAHCSHPGVSEIVAGAVIDAVRECGFPEGTFSVLFGKGRDLGQTLAKHPVVKAIGFTGSYTGGRALMDTAAARPEPIPVFAEMSAINPVLMLPTVFGENSENLAESLFGSLTLGVGQFCTNPGLIFIPEQGTEAFEAKLAELAGAGAEGVMLNQAICNSYHAGTKQLAGNASVENISFTADASEDRAKPAVFKATADTFLSDSNLNDEVFGPATLLVTYKDEQQLLELCDSLEGQLTASVFCGDSESMALDSIVAVLEEKSGRVIYNGYPTGVEVCNSMVHGGPFPATSDGRSTSVGTMAITRFTRAVSFQAMPDSLLPAELQESNPLGILRMVDGEMTR